MTYKFTPQFKAGFATGASLSLYDGNLRYLLGGSMLWGKRNKLSVTGGLSLGKIKELSSIVTVEQDGILTVPVDTESVPTFNKLKTGWFIGISYVIVSKK